MLSQSNSETSLVSPTSDVISERHDILFLKQQRPAKPTIAKEKFLELEAQKRNQIKPVVSKQDIDINIQTNLKDEVKKMAKSSKQSPGS